MMFQIGHKFSKETKDKISLTLSGRKMPKRIKLKISKTLKGKLPWNTGKRLSSKTKKRMSESSNKKEKHHAWSGGSKRYWNHIIFRRDNHTCKKCKLREPKIMTVDHIKPKSKFPHLIRAPDNMQTLCPNCHARKTIKDFKKYKLGKPKRII